MIRLRWRMFWAWWAEAEAGSRGDYALAHHYLRLRATLDAELAARRARRH